MRSPHRLNGTAFALIAALLAGSTLYAAEKRKSTLARKLYDSFRSINSLSCEIRKTVTTAGKTDRWLSRVHYQSPNRVHVENVAPMKRRIIADGTNLYYHVSDHPRGFSAPLDKLEEPMLSASRNIPATPVEHLLKLLDCPETELPGTGDFPLRRSYRAGPLNVVLSCDKQGRLVQVDFIDGNDGKTAVARYTYSAFTRARGGAWIPRRHKAVLFLPENETVTETRRIDNLVLNEPMAQSLFDASLFFKDVEFVDDLKKTTK